MDAPEVLAVKFDTSNRGEPTKQVMQVGAGAWVEFLRVVDPLKCRFQYAIRQGVVFEFIPCTRRAAVAEKIAA